MTDDERRNSEQEAADQYSRALRNPPPAEALDYMRDRLADDRRERIAEALAGHALAAEPEQLRAGPEVGRG